MLTISRSPARTRGKLVAATRELVLQRGFTGAGVEQICENAGVTKGAFFHHFKSKDEIGAAALADWAAFGMALYASAAAKAARYPLDHLHRFIAIMIGFIKDSPTPVSCVVGMISQELAGANPVLRAACANHLGEWTEFARGLLDEAKRAHPPENPFDSAELAWFLNSLWQGSMLVAKTRDEPGIAIRNLQRARAHIDQLFGESAASRSAWLKFQKSSNPTKK